MSERPPEEYYEALEVRLRDLVPLVEDLARESAAWYLEYLDAGEYGLAVETAAEALRPDMPPDRLQALASGLLREAETMRLSEAEEALRPFVR